MVYGLIFVMCAAAILYFALTVRASLRRSAEDAARLRASYREWSERLDARHAVPASEGSEEPSAPQQPSQEGRTS